MRVKYRSDDDVVALCQDAAAYRETFGDQWPEEAAAHLKLLSRNGNRVAFDRWSDVIDLMFEMDRPKH